MNQIVYFSLLFIVFDLQKLNAQANSQLIPLDIVQNYFSPDGFDNKNEYICCGLSQNLGLPYTWGQVLPPNAQTNCQLLPIDSLNSVVAVEINHPSCQQDVYVFLTKFEDSWKMVSMRSISQLDIVQVMLDRLKNSKASDWNHFYQQEKRTTFEFDYHNTNLWVAPDKIIIQHFEQNKKSFDQALQIIKKKGYLNTKILQEDKNLTKILNQLYLRNVYFDTEQCTECLLFEIGSINQNGVGYFYLDPKYKMPTMSDSYFIVIKSLGNGWFFYKTT